MPARSIQSRWRATARVRPFRSGRARRRDGREDPAAGGVELLVARAGGAERELVHAISAERRMGVAVDEPWDRAEAAGVELLDLALEGAERVHPSDRLDLGAVAEDVRVVDPVEIGERTAAQRSAAAGRARDLGEIADQEPAHAAELLQRVVPTK